MKKQVLFTFISVLFMSIATSAQTTYKIGDRAQGGTVFWVDETGQHGLIFAEETHPEPVTIVPLFNYEGGAEYFGDIPFRNGIYGGKENTSTLNAAINTLEMLGKGSSSPALTVCAEKQVSQGEVNYADWYIPSKYELNLLFQKIGSEIVLSEEKYLKLYPDSNFDVWSSTFVNGTGRTIYSLQGTAQAGSNRAYVILIRAF